MAAQSRYPNNAEVRQWARSKRAGANLPLTGQLPRYVILGWNKAHPDRPYVPSQAYHGTLGGHTTRGCRCEACCEAGNAYRSGHYRAWKNDEATA